MLHIAELVSWYQQKRIDKKRALLSSASKDSKSSEQGREAGSNVPMFQGFPYLITRLVSSFYHITLLPDTLTRQDLFDIAVNQFSYNRLNCCLVIGPDDCCYFAESGDIVVSQEPPRGGSITSNKLVLPFVPEVTPGFRQRAMMLASFEAAQNPEGMTIQFGDITKGAIQSSDKQRELLQGLNMSGVPRGLTRCPQCSEWSGACLDPDPNLADKLVLVSCLCDNRNFCARCHRRLGTRKLNSNRFDTNDGKIWHYPAFIAIKHKCCYGRGGTNS